MTAWTRVQEIFLQCYVSLSPHCAPSLGSANRLDALQDAQASEEKPSGDGVGPGPFKFTFTQVPLPQASAEAPLRQYAKRASAGRHATRKVHNPSRFPSMQSMGKWWLPMPGRLLDVGFFFFFLNLRAVFARVVF